MMDVELLDKREAARLLAIKARSLDRYISARLIPYVKIGRLVRFRRSDLIKWIERKTVKAAL